MNQPGTMLSACVWSKMRSGLGFAEHNMSYMQVEFFA